MSFPTFRLRKEIVSRSRPYFLMYSKGFKYEKNLVRKKSKFTVLIHVNIVAWRGFAESCRRQKYDDLFTRRKEWDTHWRTIFTHLTLYIDNYQDPRFFAPSLALWRTFFKSPQLLRVAVSPTIIVCKTARYQKHWWWETTISLQSYNNFTNSVREIVLAPEHFFSFKS